ncbi:MAG: hypothetical protein BVN33_07685 [Proteobacteria bacterium ST_bin13]|jgi:predicted alpha/beta superfamily hydrolase|nr:MAG: hypothetical protein BVN33_07685 [Proteobacteria bacterium ST_bin13]
MQWDGRSQASGQSYRIYAHQPPGPPPAKGYPLLVLTDAELFFASAVQQVSARAAMGDISAPLIVGVGFVDADPATVQTRRMENFGAGKAKEASAFTTFLTTELLPWVDSRWAVDPSSRSLFGFSLGALATLDMLLHQPTKFQQYIAASPSLWWNDGAMLKAFQAQPRHLHDARILVSWGDEEENPARAIGPAHLTDEERAGLVRDAQMIGNAQALVRQLRQNRSASVETWRFPDENHASVAWLSLSRAIGFALQR